MFLCLSLILGMNDMHIVWIPQIGIAGKILLNSFPGQGVTTDIFRMIRMPLYLVENHHVVLFSDGQKQKTPEILIFYRLSFAVFPVSFLPVINPMLIKGIDQICRIGMHSHLAAGF